MKKLFSLVVIFLMIVLTVNTSYAIYLESLFDVQLSSITLYEGTGIERAFTLPINDIRLMLDENEGPPDYHQDLVGGGPYMDWETYDIFISDRNGLLDYENGAYLTIGCFHYFSQQNILTGNNINAVSLDFVDGSHIWASEVTHFQLGTGLSGDYLANNGYVLRALGPPDAMPGGTAGIPEFDNAFTFMGSGQSSMTLGFAVIPEPSTVILLGLGLIGLAGYMRNRCP